MSVLSDQATHLDVTAPSEVETAVAKTESPGKKLPSQDCSLEAGPLSDMSEDKAYELEKSGEVREPVRIQEPADVEETALGSPFPSPKLVAGDCASVVSLKENGTMEKMSSRSAVASPVPVHSRKEQSTEKVELKLEASPTARKDSLVASTPEIQAEITEVSTETEDNGSKTDTDATVEASKSSKVASSIPPHRRPDFQSPPSRHFGAPDSRMMPPNEVVRYNESPRAPRSQYTSYQPRGDHMDREQIARISAQLTKTKHELDNERTKNRQLRPNIEAEQQRKVEAASSTMLANLLRDQAGALTLKAKAESRQRELDLREQKISQHEVYLSEGQKQLWFSLEKNGVRPMSAVQTEHARREAGLNAQKAIADVTGKLNIKLESLRLREAAQQMREQQYKALIRESLKAELENTLTDEKANEIAKTEYTNGYKAGKEAGRKEALETSHQRGFLEGYNVCHRAQVTLSKVRKGLIPRDSPELDFLYDANHPHNLWNIGELVGRLQLDDKTSRLAGVVKKHDGTEQKTPLHSGNHEAHGETASVDGRVNGDAIGSMMKKREEPVCKMPPSRPTFAAELRGPSATHNGHIILANNAASAVAKETERPVISKYEDPVVNLIDFM